MDSDLEWGDDAVSRGDSLANQQGSAEGVAPDLKGVPRTLAGQGELSGMVESDVTQKGVKQSARSDLGEQNVFRSFDEGLKQVDPQKVAAEKKKEGTHSSFRRAEPMLKDAQADLPETEMKLADGAVTSTLPIGNIIMTAWGRSIFEKISWLALIALLVGFVNLLIVPAIRDLPEKSHLFGSEEFPVQGNIVTLRSAATYWRAPVMDGPDADTIRRGTKLLPVIELHVEGGPAAIRALFRGSDGSVLGDLVTMPVEESRVLKIPATAGFDEVSMFAEYRTGEVDFWTVEVSEAESVNAAKEDFKKLFEIKIQPILQP